MPRNQFERMMFALMTVIVTVHAYVFYSLYVINGAALMNVTGEPGVLKAINAMGGVYIVLQACLQGIRHQEHPSRPVRDNDHLRNGQHHVPCHSASIFA